MLTQEIRVKPCEVCGAKVEVCPDAYGLLPTELHGERMALHHWRACELTVELKRLQAENDRLRHEVELDNKRLADFDRILDALECPEHGRCVPYAEERIRELNHSAKPKEDDDATET